MVRGIGGEFSKHVRRNRTSAPSIRRSVDFVVASKRSNELRVRCMKVPIHARRRSRNRAYETRRGKRMDDSRRRSLRSRTFASNSRTVAKPGRAFVRLVLGVLGRYHKIARNRRCGPRIDQAFGNLVRHPRSEPYVFGSFAQKNPFRDRSAPNDEIPGG